MGFRGLCASGSAGAGQVTQKGALVFGGAFPAFCREVFGSEEADAHTIHETSCPR